MSFFKFSSLSIMFFMLLSFGSSLKINAWGKRSESLESLNEQDYIIFIAPLPDSVRGDEDYENIKLFLEEHIPSCRRILTARISSMTEEKDAAFADLARLNELVSCQCKKSSELCKQRVQEMNSALTKYIVASQKISFLARNHDPISEKEENAKGMLDEYTEKNSQEDDLSLEEEIEIILLENEQAEYESELTQ